MPTSSTAQRKSFWATLIAELPAFVHFLTRQWDIPAELQSPRFGISHYHHAAVAASIDPLTTDERILQAIDASCFSGTGPIHHDAIQLFEILATATRDEWPEFKNIVCSPCALGALLARLARKYPDRIHYHRTNKERIWTINPPPARFD